MHRLREPPPRAALMPQVRIAMHDSIHVPRDVDLAHLYRVHARVAESVVRLREIERGGQEGRYTSREVARAEAEPRGYSCAGAKRTVADSHVARDPRARAEARGDSCAGAKRTVADSHATRESRAGRAAIVSRESRAGRAAFRAGRAATVSREPRAEAEAVCVCAGGCGSSQENRNTRYGRGPAQLPCMCDCECQCAAETREPRAGAEDVYVCVCAGGCGSSQENRNTRYGRGPAQLPRMCDCEYARAERGSEQEAQRGEHEARERTVSSVTEDLAVHMQRRLLGVIMRRVYETQDFFSIMYRDWGSRQSCVPAGFKAMMSDLNDALIPWLAVAAQIVRHKQLERLSLAWGERGPPTGNDLKDGNAIVYARVNLTTESMYVGETEHWQSRQHQHMDATFRHSTDCKSGCKGCREHKKYRMHRVVKSSAWITLPVRVCNSKMEAKRLERWATLKWKPSLNQGDLPFWMLRYNYQASKETESRGAGARPPPWARGGDGGPPERIDGAKETERKPLLTEYICVDKDGEEQARAVDFGALLHTGSTEAEAMFIRIQPGTHDMTRWKRVKQVFKRSIIRQVEGEGTSQVRDVVMCEWNHEKVLRRRGATLLKITATKDLEWQEQRKRFKEITVATEALEKMSEEELATTWRIRKHASGGFGTRIWEECERRYEGFTRKPIEIRMPYFDSFSVPKFRAVIGKLLKEKGWPEHLVNWHLQKLKVTTAKQTSVADILSNVNKPWCPSGGCTCDKVRQRLKEAGWTGALPTLNGHIFFIGREYTGPHREVLNQCNANVPHPSRFDLLRTWERMRDNLPQGLCGKERWKTLLKECTPNRERNHYGDCPTTRDVYKLRKCLDGMVIAPIDKNTGEFSICCPVLYEEARRDAFSKENGYEDVFPRKLTAYKKRKFPKITKLRRHIMGKTSAKKREQGTERDIINVWHKEYQQRGWDKITSFEKRGGFNTPYVLFKAKNITDPEVRRAKWKKVRPIAPGTKHPMRKLLGLVGRAWAFVTRQLPGEHLVLNKCQDMPRFFREAEEKLGKHGDIGCAVKDIEGCFPHMPKKAIRMALREYAATIKRSRGVEGVIVPKRSKKQPCQWKVRSMRGRVLLTFEVMLDVMEFALDNAVLALDGRLIRQAKGIPMGDPISPGMTIGACAWMEKEWLASIAEHNKGYFHAGRYMDDIIMLYTKAPWWDHERFLSDFERSECYMKPLKLEDSKPDTFLETSFKIDGNRVEHWLKNDNKCGEQPKVWRYQTYASYVPFARKKANLLASLGKVERMANTKAQLIPSAKAKLWEFERLGYPRGLRRLACAYVAMTSGNTEWLHIRDSE